MPSRLEPAPLGGYNIVCPHCENQSSYDITSEICEGSCPSCGKRFRILLARVRAKRGRASKGTREYVLRIITQSEDEKVIRFEDAGGSDLDLRSRDVMYICYKITDKGKVEEHPSVLCNVTTNKYTKIKKGCFIATVTCGYNSSEVKILSDFRDNALSQNTIGILFTRFYYRVSPKLADFISDKTRIKGNIRRFIVSPISKLVSKLFKGGLNVDKEVRSKKDKRKN